METATISELQNSYELNRQHLSDLLFFEDEAKFIKTILDRFFLPKLTEYNVTRAKLINGQLQQLNLLRANVTRDILLHQAHLEASIKDASGRSIDFIKLEGGKMDEEIKDINKRFRNIKKEVHAIYKALEPDDSAAKSCSIA